MFILIFTHSSFCDDGQIVITIHCSSGTDGASPCAWGTDGDSLCAPLCVRGTNGASLCASPCALGTDGNSLVPEVLMAPHCVSEALMVPHCVPKALMVPHWVPEAPMVTHCVPEAQMALHCVPEAPMVPHCVPEVGNEHDLGHAACLWGVQGCLEAKVKSGYKVKCAMWMQRAAKGTLAPQRA